MPTDDPNAADDDLPLPQAGGSYLRDDSTGALTPVNQPAPATDQPQSE